MTRSRAATLAGPAAVGGALALIFATLIALSLAWAQAAGGWDTFGYDLRAYESAAARLLATGSPYSPELHAGPIANDARNVRIGYFYPPPLAQLFTLTTGTDHRLLAVLWTLPQALLSFLLLPRVWRHSGGAPGLTPMLWLAAFAIASYPFQFALVIGNVSGWSAVLVAALLIAVPRAQGWLAGGLALLKTVNAPIFLASVIERRSRWPAVAFVAGVGIVSLVASFQAWLDWLRVLPNILALPPGGAPSSVSLASMFRDTALGPVAAAAGILAGVACFGEGLWLLRTEGFSRRVITATVSSSLLLNPTLWDHYLAAMVPIAIAAWPNVPNRWRAVLVLGGLTHVVAWLGALDILRAYTVFGGFVAIAFASLAGDRQPRVTSPSPLTAQGSSSG